MKGRAGPQFAMYVIIAILLVAVLVPLALDFINGAGEAAKGCSTSAALISDMFEGGIQLC